MKKSILIITIASSLFFFSCKNDKGDGATSYHDTEESHSHAEGEEHDHAKESGQKAGKEESTNKEVELNLAQYKASDIELGDLQQKNLTDVIKVNGLTELPAQSQADVTSLLSGTITKIYVNLGDKVTKGQVIATADSPEYIRLQEEYLISKNNLEYLELEYKRQQTLRSEKVNSEKTYQKTKSELNIEKSRFQSLTNQLLLLNTDPNKPNRTLRIFAPMTGNIATIPIKIGTYITNGQSLFTMVDNTKIHLDLMVYEKDLPSIKVGQKVTFSLTNIDQSEISATIFSIGKSFEPGTKTVIAHANIDKPNDNLIPGLSVNALVLTGKQEVDALPNEAIIKAEGREFIFVCKQDPSNKEAGKHFEFERIEVKTGISELGYTQVTLLQNRPKNSKIVLKGSYYLQSSLLKNEGGTDHAH